MSFDVLQDKIKAKKNPTVAGLDARVEYWGQVSQVTRTPRALACRTMSTPLAVEMWQMWTWAPVSSASITSRMTWSSSATAGRPGSPSFRETAPSLTA